MTKLHKWFIPNSPWYLKINLWPCLLSFLQEKLIENEMEFLWFVFPCSVPGSFYHVEFMVRQVLQIGCGCWTNRFIIFTIHNSCWNLKQTKILQMKYLTFLLVCMLYIQMYACRRDIDSSLPKTDMKVRTMKIYKSKCGCIYEKLSIQIWRNKRIGYTIKSVRNASMHQ